MKEIQNQTEKKSKNAVGWSSSLPPFALMKYSLWGSASVNFSAPLGRLLLSRNDNMSSGQIRRVTLMRNYFPVIALLAVSGVHAQVPSVDATHKAENRSAKHSSAVEAGGYLYVPA